MCASFPHFIIIIILLCFCQYYLMVQLLNKSISLYNDVPCIYFSNKLSVLTTCDMFTCASVCPMSYSPDN